MYASSKNRKRRGAGLSGYRAHAAPFFPRWEDSHFAAGEDYETETVQKLLVYKTMLHGELYWAVKLIVTCFL